VPHGGGGGPTTQRLLTLEGEPSHTKFGPTPGTQWGHGVHAQHEETLAGVPARWHGLCGAWQLAAVPPPPPPPPPLLRLLLLPPPVAVVAATKSKGSI
jgi:hypothetical protein